MIGKGADRSGRIGRRRLECEAINGPFPSIEQHHAGNVDGSVCRLRTARQCEAAAFWRGDKSPVEVYLIERRADDVEYNQTRPRREQACDFVNRWVPTEDNGGDRESEEGDDENANAPLYFEILLRHGLQTNSRDCAGFFCLQILVRGRPHGPEYQRGRRFALAMALQCMAQAGCFLKYGNECQNLRVRCTSLSLEDTKPDRWRELTKLSRVASDGHGVTFVIHA